MGISRPRAPAQRAECIHRLGESVTSPSRAKRLQKSLQKGVKPHRA